MTFVETETEEQAYDDIDLEHGLDELSRPAVDDLIDKIMAFIPVLVGHDLHGYQKPLARRMIESVVIGDGDEITACASRQSGKSEVVADVVCVLMVLLPVLCRFYPVLLSKFKSGVLVGLFAPVEGQVETLFGRVVDRLTSEQAQKVLEDDDFKDKVISTRGITKGVRLERIKSQVVMMTANPRAKIESKSFHIIIIDECQETVDYVVNKSISPMRAYYAGTMVKTGTPTTTKNNFYQSIQLNKRRSTTRKGKQNHFEWNWKDVIKFNKNYHLIIKKEMLRLGEDSDEFQMSYNCRWVLDRGMFVTDSVMEEMGDPSQKLVTNWHRSPVVVGIDPARKLDSTVVTVVWVDWDRPDEFGYYNHRILNWLEIKGDDWESQYYQIVNFLANYDVLGVAVDANGVGDAVAERLRLLLPRAEVVSVTSSSSEQTKRWTHLQALIQRRKIGYPAHSHAKRLRVWKSFYQQMVDLEKNYKGPNMVVAAPDEAHAHDDYPDSLALACSLTKDLIAPSVEISSNFFYTR